VWYEWDRLAYAPLPGVLGQEVGIGRAQLSAAKFLLMFIAYLYYKRPINVYFSFK
jgi:hypothetical protein